jgi:hypothetical protein
MDFITQYEQLNSNLKSLHTIKSNLDISLQTMENNLCRSSLFMNQQIIPYFNFNAQSAIKSLSSVLDYIDAFNKDLNEFLAKADPEFKANSIKQKENELLQLLANDFESIDAAVFQKQENKVTKKKLENFFIKKIENIQAEEAKVETYLKKLNRGNDSTTTRANENCYEKGVKKIFKNLELSNNNFEITALSKAKVLTKESSGFEILIPKSLTILALQSNSFEILRSSIQPRQRLSINQSIDNLSEINVSTLSSHSLNSTLCSTMLNPFVPTLPTVSSDVIVYVTRTGSKYHKSSCGYLHSSKIPMNFKDAKGSYSPCSRCY